MHQNKPTAPIEYIGEFGKKFTLPEDESQWPIKIRFLHLTLAEAAILQTLTNRALMNCNCNLNKKVLKGIVDKVNHIITMYDEAKEGE